MNEIDIISTNEQNNFFLHLNTVLSILFTSRVFTIKTSRIRTFLCLTKPVKVADISKDTSLLQNRVIFRKLRICRGL
jgi:hypothetical protein